MTPYLRTPRASPIAALRPTSNALGRARLGGLLLAALLGSAGCGNLTAGGFGEARVAASGDAPDPTTAPRSEPVAAVLASTPVPLLPMTGPGPALSDHDADDVDPEGEMELQFRLFLDRADGSFVSLSESELEVELDLGGELEADVVQALVPADRYVALRVVFSEIEVQVSAGVILGGVTILGPVDVEFEGPGLEIVRPIDLEVRDGSIVELLLDLNAATWLALTDPDLRTVSEAEFSGAFDVRVR